MSTEAPGLRERKKQATREAIQDHALRLYQEQGYSQTTVEQIAAAANVSQSTFFRYFPTKPDTVIYDRFDPRFVESLLAQPADLPLLAAMRAAMHEVLGALAGEQLGLEMTRMRLVVDVPELRAAAAQQMETGVQMFAKGAAQRAGREPDDLEVYTWVGAVAGAVLAGIFAAVQRDTDILEAVDAAISRLEAGLPL